MPRSGTNWVSQIFASCPDVRLKFCPLFSYEFKNALDLSSSGKQWQTFFDSVYSTPGDYLDQNYLRKDGLLPIFEHRVEDPPFLVIKSTRNHHLTESILMKHDGVRFVALIRHPAAVIHSWLSNALEFPVDADPMDHWRDGACRKNHVSEFWGFNDWLDVTEKQLTLATQYPERMLLYRYEDFVSAAAATTQRLFSELGIKLSKQTLDFVHVSQTQFNDHARAVFKDPGLTQRWKTDLNPLIREEIERDLQGTRAEAFINGAL